MATTSMGAGGCFIAALVANYAGWYTAEMGRQPWIVRGLMYTKDASVPADAQTTYIGVLLSVIAWIIPVVLWKSLGLKRRINLLLGR